MALSRISDSSMCIHARLYLNLLVAHGLRVSLAVQSDGLFLVTDSLNAAIVELFKSGWHGYLNCGHRWEFGLVHSSKRRAKERTLHLRAVFVTDVIKSVVFQKVVVENCIAVLLVNIATMVEPIWSFNALS